MIYQGTLRLTFRVAYVHSLKEKRAIVKSIKQKVRNVFPVVIVEVEELDRHNYMVFGLTTISSGKDVVDNTLQKTVDFILDHFDVELIQEELYREHF
ncbi:MAG TPA: DUF503 domain-containing protein [Clostridiaceae bacterium]|nr:DUF503 domain-containing protein [Clostridiaceae bacterium]